MAISDAFLTYVKTHPFDGGDGSDAVLEHSTKPMPSPTRAIRQIFKTALRSWKIFCVSSP